MAARPFAWESAYPPGVSWDAPIVPKTVVQLLDEAAERFGDRPFIEFRGQRIGFSAFACLVDRAAAGFRAIGVRTGVTVALYLPNTPYHLIAFFAVLRAGGQAVNLTPLDPLRSLERKLSDSGARIAVVPDAAPLLHNALALLRSGHLNRLVVGEDAHWGPDPDAVPVAPVPDYPDVTSFAELGAGQPLGDWPVVAPGDLALLQYTGGTTGLPRAAMLTHGNLNAAVASQNAWFHGDWSVGDRVVGVLPLFHIYMLSTVMLRCLTNGVEIMLRARFDPARTLDDIEHGRATIFPGVPTMFVALAGQPGLGARNLSSLREAICGGAPLPLEVLQRFERLTGRRMSGGWGMTEASPTGTTILPGMDMRPGLIGVPFPGIEMEVADLRDPSRVLPPGQTGELRIRGANVTAGYWNRPDETGAAFADGFFLTGDIGYMDQAGNFYIIDRKKEMIISGGFNVYPRIIEDAIYEHLAVEECLVIGIPDEYRGQSAKAFVKLRDGAAPFTLGALRDFLQDKLGRHELPSALAFRDALPRTPVGKLSRKDLREQD